MRKMATLLLVIAELLFLSSLLLPAVEHKVLGHPVALEGWRVASAAILSAGDIVRDPSVAVLFAAGLGNAVFLVAPLLLIFRTRVATRQTFCAAVGCAF